MQLLGALDTPAYPYQRSHTNAFFLAGTRSLHVQLLGALNIAGGGAHVFRTSVIGCLEFFLTTRRAQAQGFEMALPPGYQAALKASTGGRVRVLCLYVCVVCVCLCVCVCVCVCVFVCMCVCVHNGIIKTGSACMLRGST